MALGPLLLIASLLPGTAPNEGQAEVPSPCARVPKGGIAVDVDAGRLHLCRGETPEASYAVNLGQAGFGKIKQGDQKTPLGRYRLGAPRPSASGFTFFVPIGYPTAAQKKAGYTGGAIGIHGPPDWMPQAVIDRAFATPWTDGCIMVRTKGEIEAIRAWILENHATHIEIYSGPAPAER